jgi:hypothetical protein
MGAGSGPQTPAASGFNQNCVVNGLNSFSVTVPYAGPYIVKGKISLPGLVDGQGVPGQASASSLVVTINQNGSPKYTGPTGAEGFKTSLNCAANDVLQVALSSSNSNDSSLTVKTTVEFSQGVA